MPASNDYVDRFNCLKGSCPDLHRVYSHSRFPQEKSVRQPLLWDSSFATTAVDSLLFYFPLDAPSGIVLVDRQQVGQN